MTPKDRYALFVSGSSDNPSLRLYTKEAVEECWNYLYDFTSINRYFQDVAISSDGVNIAAIVGADNYTFYSSTYYAPRIILSNNGGQSWNTLSNINNYDDDLSYNSVAISDDGKYILVCGNRRALGNGEVLISSDYGTNFKRILSKVGDSIFRFSVRAWSYVCMSRSGQMMYAVAENTNIFRSTDYGDTWEEVNKLISITDPVVAPDPDFPLADASYTGNLSELFDNIMYSGGITITDPEDVYIQVEVNQKSINRIAISPSSAADIKFYIGATEDDINWSFYRYAGSNEFILATDKTTARSNPRTGVSGYVINNFANEIKPVKIRIYFTNAVSTNIYEINYSATYSYREIQCSYDGRTVIALAGKTTNSVGGRIYASDDYGSTWNEVRPNGIDEDQNWSSVALSADGNKAIIAQCWFSWATSKQGKVYLAEKTSLQHWSNISISWSEITPATGIDSWHRVRMSGNGEILMIGGGRLRSWSQGNSADIGIEGGQKIYTSYDNGLNWKDENPWNDEYGEPGATSSASGLFVVDSQSKDWSGIAIDYSGDTRIICCRPFLGGTASQNLKGRIFIFKHAKFSSDKYQLVEGRTSALTSDDGTGPPLITESFSKCQFGSFFENSPTNTLVYGGVSIENIKKFVITYEASSSANPTIFTMNNKRRPNYITARSGTNSAFSYIGKCCAISEDNIYYAAGYSGYPYCQMWRYNTTGPNYTSSVTLSTLPTAGIYYDMQFKEISGSLYFALGGSQVPYLRIYQRSSDYLFNYLSGNPSISPTSTVRSLTFSKDGTYLVVGIETINDEKILIYKYISGTFTKISDLSLANSGTIPFSLEFTYNDKYLLVGVQNSSEQALRIFERDNDNFTEIPPEFAFDVRPKGIVRGISSSNNKYLISVATESDGNKPYAMIYEYALSSSSSSISGSISSSSSSSKSTTTNFVVYNPFFTFETSGDANWFSQSIVYKDSSNPVALQAGLITHSQNSYLTWYAPAKGKIGFYCRTSSETYNDPLIIYLNGMMIQRATGYTSANTIWVFHSFTVDIGDKVEWRYFKNSSVSQGSDTVWVTDFIWQPYKQFYDQESLSSSSSSLSSESLSSSSNSLSSSSRSSSSQSSSSESIEVFGGRELNLDGLLFNTYETRNFTVSTSAPRTPPNCLLVTSVSGQRGRGCLEWRAPNRGILSFYLNYTHSSGCSVSVLKRGSEIPIVSIASLSASTPGYVQYTVNCAKNDLIRWRLNKDSTASGTGSLRLDDFTWYYSSSSSSSSSYSSSSSSSSSSSFSSSSSSSSSSCKSSSSSSWSFTCWSNFFDNTSWSALYGTWTGSAWNSVFKGDYSGPGYGNIVYLQSIGDWYLSYRPIKVRVAFTMQDDIEYVNYFAIQNSTFTSPEIISYFAYRSDPGDPYHELDMNFSANQDIKYFLFRDPNYIFTITNIEFFDCESSSSSSSRSSSSESSSSRSSSSESSSSDSCIKFFKLKDDHVDIWNGSWNDGTEKFVTETQNWGVPVQLISMNVKNYLYSSLEGMTHVRINFTGPKTTIGTCYIGWEFYSEEYLDLSSGQLIETPDHPYLPRKQYFTSFTGYEYDETDPYDLEFILYDGCGFSLSISSSSSSYSSSSSSSQESSSSSSSTNMSLGDSGLYFTTDGNALWYSQSSTYRTTPPALQSGPLPGFTQYSHLRWTAPSNGTLSFYWKVSSETNYDWLTLYVNNIQITRISGTVNWTQITRSLNAGDLVRWTYFTDSIYKIGSDCGWVDDLIWTPS